MSEPRRLICSQCEHQAPWTEFSGESTAARCPKCGSDVVRFADYEPSTFGGLTAAQWQLIRELAERELRTGLTLVGQGDALAAVVAVAEEEALPAIAAIDEIGVFGYLEEATAALEEEQSDTAIEEERQDDWVDESRAELLVAIDQAPEPLRETLVELVDSLCEALAEREATLVASVAVAAGLGGELERDTGSIGGRTEPGGGRES
jgi:hypothetical protein